MKTTLREQIDELANFIMAKIDGEPSRNEGAVECAIRIMKEQRDRIAELEAAPIASEALFGFSAWLTSRDDPIVISARHDASAIAELVGIYCEANNLEDPRSCYPGNITWPAQEGE